MKNKRTYTSKIIAQTAIMAAVICILGPLSIPIGLIPVSLTPFAVFLSVYILGWKLGTAAYIIYLLIGLVGLPVYSGFAGGAQKLFGPTGGYLFSFIFMAIIAGLFIDHYKNVIIQFIGCAAALCVSYLIGTVWLAIQANMTAVDAVKVAVLPFIGFDMIKIASAIAVGKPVRAALTQAHLLPKRA